MKITGLVPILGKEAAKELRALRFDDGKSLLNAYVDMLKSLDVFGELVLVAYSESDVKEFTKELEMSCIEVPELPNTHAVTVANAANSKVDADIIVVCNYQNPFVDAGHILDCVEAVKSGEHKWSFTGQKREALYWNVGEDKPINGNASGVKPVHVEIEAIYAFCKTVFQTIGDEKPCIIEVDGAEVYGLKNPMGFEFLKVLYGKNE